jgi:pyruvate dehydrogenase E2 component (dihydrolipoamide acetyltransferase)
VLAEVETDKAIMELVARGDGTLRKQLVAEGVTAPIGTLLGVIAGPSEDISALLGASAATTTPAAAVALAPNTGAQTSGAFPPTPPLPQVGGGRTPPLPDADGGRTPPLQEADGGRTPPLPEGDGGRVRSSPLARRLAAERGVDLHGVAGSGPNGRIVKRDIDEAVAGERAVVAPAARVQAPAVAPVPPVTGDGYHDIPLSPIRRTIARRLAESIGPVPTFYLTAEYDVERLSEMRAAMAEQGDEYRVSVNDIVLKAVATALSQHPEVNAQWLGDKIRQFSRVHLGMAVAIEEGLITPVLFDADRKRLRDLSREARELAGRARERKLKPEEYTGSTFSVSNLGMFGIDQFTAIINPPEAGILAIGGIDAKPVVVGGAIVPRRRMRVTMSCDHRVIDGATGAKFLSTLRRLIENPLMLVY